MPPVAAPSAHVQVGAFPAIPGPVRQSRAGARRPTDDDEAGSLLKIYTRGGDAGETVLIGGLRVRKDDPRVRAYGGVDELNSTLGLALSLDRESRHVDAVRVGRIQEDLFTIGARLAAVDPDRAIERGTIPELDPGRIEALERWIDEMDEELPELDAFVLPGGAAVGAQLHVARTVCRRAERAIVGLLDDRPDLADLVIPYLNRLSDLLFTLARHVNARAGAPEAAWLPQRRRDHEDAEGAAPERVDAGGTDSETEGGEA
jgi:cob(I)alamin adenosyltransferase